MRARAALHGAGSGSPSLVTMADVGRVCSRFASRTQEVGAGRDAVRHGALFGRAMMHANDARTA